MRRHRRGAGFELAYGPALDDAADVGTGAVGRGGAAGVAVRFEEWPEAKLLVIHDGVTVHESAPPGWWLGGVDDAATVEVAFEAAGLRVWHSAHGALLRNFPLVPWAPDDSWFLRVAAESGAYPASYALLSVQAALGAAAATRVAAVELALNGQQFTDDGVPFTYYAEPMVSRVEPAHGPASGLSRVTVFGANLVNGSHYVCAFGAKLVPGTYDGVVGGRTGAIRCVTPDPQFPGAPAPVEVEVSLNGQQFSHSAVAAVEFDYREPPALTRLVPDRGPPAGGTRVNIYGEHFSGMAAPAYLCRFGDAIPEKCSP